MKKLLLLIICAASILTASAQTEKGNKLVGVSIGGAGYSNTDNTTSYTNTPTVYKSDNNEFYIQVNPTVAWFIQDNLAVGGQVAVGFSTSKSKSRNTGSPTTSESKYNEFAVYIGPMARYYFGGSNKGKPFGEINANAAIYPSTSKSSTSTGASSETKEKPKGSFSGALVFGYEHFINNSIGLVATIGFRYSHSKSTYEYRPSSGSGYDYTSTSKGFTIPVGVGFLVHIAGKKAKK